MSTLMGPRRHGPRTFLQPIGTGAGFGTHNGVVTASVGPGELGSTRVLGVDACRSGWIGIALGDQRVSAYAAPSITGVVTAAEAAGPLTVVAVDIPIGLPDAGRRRADVLARKVVGPRRSSVFLTPVRPALLATDHATAARLNRQIVGEGISIQAFSLRTKILDVDRFVGYGSHHVVEVHPEVSFTHLAGGHLPDSKTTWAGTEHRRALLRDAGIVLPGDLGPAGRTAGVDDVLDAAVAAWTAQRVATGNAERLPDPPEVFSDRHPAAIWA
jgi:predicted RNase H-like nuclease